MGQITIVESEGRPVVAPRIECRDGRLYEGTTPLQVRSNSFGLFVGCTFVTWPAWEEIEKRVKKMRGQE